MYSGAQISNVRFVFRTRSILWSEIEIVRSGSHIVMIYKYGPTISILLCMTFHLQFYNEKKRTFYTLECTILISMSNSASREVKSPVIVRAISRQLAQILRYLFLHAGIPISQQHLVWRSVELEDDYCLHDYK